MVIDEREVQRLTPARHLSHEALFLSVSVKAVHGHAHSNGIEQLFAKFLHGTTASTVSIITEELQGVVVVPTTAISYRGNATTVTLDSDGKKVTRDVDIGAASGGDTQVTSGLSVGEKIYVTQVTFHGGLGTGTRASLFGGGGTGGFSGGGFSGRGGFGGGGGFGG